MKKVFSLVMIGILAASAVFAQGSGEGQSGAKKVKLTIAGRDGAYGDAMQIAVNDYMAQHPNVDIELLKLSGSSLFEKTVIDIKTQTGTYDIILIDDTNVTQFQKSGWLVDLDNLYKEEGKTVDSDLIPSTVKLGRYPYADNGTLFAMPIVGNVELFAYRKDLMAKYGYENPTTYSQILEAVKKIDAGEKGVDGVVFRGVKGNPIVTGFLPIFWAFGGHVLDADGNVTFDSPQARAAMNYFLELAKYAPEGVSMYQSTQVKDAIYAGTAAVATEVWPGWIGELENPEKSKVVGKVAVVKSPGEKVNASSMLGVWLAAIPTTSQHQKAAFDFLQFLTSKDMQSKMSLETGVPPTRVSVFKEEAQQAKYPWYTAQLDALENGVARPRSVKWKEIEDQLGTVLQEAILGNYDAKQAVAEATKDIKSVLE
ncbi:MAG: extracellular solute-binding protein [Spirochaetia bacterium]|jgi:multiple sugar transport system substrate-binding protein|nr:extracellular solute-binding protein [Spirochaetia bacterium]